MDVDCDLAARLQEKEKGELSIEEKSRMFVELMDKRKRYFARIKAEKIRSKPPTKAQKRNQMCTYLKNMANYKRSLLKSKSFKEIQILFNNTIKWIEAFVPMDTELEKARKRLEEENESAELKRYLEIIPEDDDDVTFEATPYLLNLQPLLIIRPIKKERRAISKSSEQMEVIVNGDSVTAVASASTEGHIPPKTAKQMLARKNELKAKSTLMLTIPDEHLLKFHACKDAKSLWEAIKSKKMKKTILKQNYENFAASSQEGLDKTYDSTNETFNTAHSVSATSSKNQASTASYVDEVMFSFFSNQSNAPQLDNEDLEQINTDDLEKMDLKWQVPMLTMRVKRRGHFARECMAPKNQGNRNRDAPIGNALVDTSTTNALVVQDGIGGYDWSFQAEEELTNFAVMAYTSQGSSSSNSEELKFNHFSVSQMCDKKNSVLFADTECVVLSPDFKLIDESQVLLKVPRNNNMYSFDFKNVVPVGGIENKIDHKVKTIKCDNGTEFKNRIMNEFCEIKGYSINSKAFRVFNINTKIVEENLHINFLENKPNVIGIGPNWIFDIDTLTMSMNYQPVFAGYQINGNGDLGKERAQRNEFKSMFGQDKNDDGNRMFTHVSAVGSTYVYLGGSILINAATLLNVDLPTDPLMPDLEDTIDLQDSRILVVYMMMKLRANKKDERGIIVNNKARPLAQGHTQEEGIDYDEMDVKSAFLYGIIEDEVYVCQPLSFEDPHFPNKVYKVEKAVYGLHQAPKAGYETLSTYLLENGFKRGIIDKTLFIKKDKGLMHKKFQMSSIGELTFFLGLQVMQKHDGIFISQDKYVANILKTFYFSSVKTTCTLIATNKALLKDKEAEDVDVYLYRSMIRSLMYLTASRPDIMFAVCACTRFQVTPKVSHLYAVKKIFRYLKS
nr:hypothetical protein [Tanacetum cinerariifolium]